MTTLIARDTSNQRPAGRFEPLPGDRVEREVLR